MALLMVELPFWSKMEFLTVKTSLNTSLQTIALRITLHRAITVCSIYLPPTAKYYNAVIDNIITIGDFNAHSHLWGCHKTTIHGKQIEDFLLNHNLFASCN